MTMRAHEIADIELRRRAHGKRYEEFVREGSMSLGLYVLPAGGIDPQQPHTEAEAYVVMRGRGRSTVSGEEYLVGPGSVVIVPANAEHPVRTRWTLARGTG